MRVEVARIKDNPLKTQETIAAADWGLDNYDVKFPGAIEVACVFERIGNEILVEVKTGYAREATCSRCLKAVKENIENTFRLNYNALTQGEFLDIDDDVREQILLNFPMRFLCRPDCRGMCSRCGEDLNDGSCTCK